MKESRLSRARLIGAWDRLAELSPAAAEATVARALLQDEGAQEDRLGRPLVLCLVGATGAGKSTLLNALAGEPIATEGIDRPTTSTPLIFHPAGARLEDLLMGIPGGAPRTQTYSGKEGRAWPAFILIDAPDTNSLVLEHHATVRALAERSDLLLVVAHRQSVAELRTMDFLADFAERRRLLFLLNRSDELGPEERDLLLAQIRQLAKEYLGDEGLAILAVSAERAKADPLDHEFVALLRALRDLGSAARQREVQIENLDGIRSQLMALGKNLEERLQPTFAELDSLGQAADAALLEEMHALLKDGMRWREAALAARLTEEWAARWDGPGGLALRAGGWSSLGMAAGWAARRNPLLAAGAMASGVALQAGQSRLRQHQLQRDRDLLPSAGLEELVHRHQGELRMKALSLHADPQILGIGSPAELADRLQELASLAWAELLEEDLPRRAQQSARWWWKLPVDLPVYAMAAWIVWQAATGFFAGDYVGVDFLLNAALLSFAWLALWRLLLRGVLRNSARRQLKAAREKLARRLEVEVDSRARQREATLAPWQRDLQTVAAKEPA